MSAEPPVLPEAADARRWAAEELAKPEYREAAPSWLDELWRGFLDWLQSVGGSPGPAGTVPGAAIGIVIAVILAVAVILARPRPDPGKRPAGSVFEPETALTGNDYRQRAEASAAAGRWGDAVVDRFRALVRSAEERTIMDPQPGRTADEVASALSVPFPAEALRLGHAAQTFDAIRYGNQAAGGQDYAALAALDAALEAATPARTMPQDPAALR